MLVAVLGQPRSQQLLETSQSTSREHLGAQRVGLELLDVGSQVALGPGILRATGQCCSDSLGQRVLSTGARKRASRGHSASDILGCLSECVSLKLDRHGGDVGLSENEGRRKKKSTRNVRF